MKGRPRALVAGSVGARAQACNARSGVIGAARPTMLLAAPFVLSLLPHAVRCQAADEQGVEGTWEVRWAQGIRTGSGNSVQVRRWGSAELVLTVEGDSVTGRWTTDGPMSATWTMAGSFRDGRLRLTSEGHDSDDPELAVIGGMDVSGTLVEGRLEGTLLLSLRGRTGVPAPRPWSAVRAEASRPH